MKNKRIFLLFLFIFFIFLLSTTSYAGSQKLTSLNYEVKLNVDGSADVKEIWNINVSDTNTLFKTFELNKAKYGDITDVEVSEITKSGEKKEFIDTKTYAYHVQKGGFYALKRNVKDFEIAWGVSISGTESKIYEIKYKIEDAVKNYNDCSEFYWQFTDKTNAIPANKVKGTVYLPKQVIEGSNLKVWAHGPLNRRNTCYR